MQVGEGCKGVRFGDEDRGALLPFFVRERRTRGTEVSGGDKPTGIPAANVTLQDVRPNHYSYKVRHSMISLSTAEIEHDAAFNHIVQWSSRKVLSNGVGTCRKSLNETRSRPDQPH